MTLGRVFQVTVATCLVCLAGLPADAQIQSAPSYGGAPDSSGRFNRQGGGFMRPRQQPAPDMSGSFNRQGGGWSNQGGYRPQSQYFRPQYQPQYARPSYVQPSTSWSSPSWSPSASVPSTRILSQPTVRPNVLPSASGDIKLLLPESAGGGLAYSLNEYNYEIGPGQTQTLSSTGSWTVRFDRGGDFGTAEYRLNPGTYVFKPTERGWELFHRKGA